MECLYIRTTLLLSLESLLCKKCYAKAGKEKAYEVQCMAKRSISKKICVAYVCV